VYSLVTGNVNLTSFEMDVLGILCLEQFLELLDSSATKEVSMSSALHMLPILYLLEHHPLLVDTLPDILNASSGQPSPDRVHGILSWGEELGDLIGSVVLSVPGRSWVGTRRMPSV